MSEPRPGPSSSTSMKEGAARTPPMPARDDDDDPSDSDEWTSNATLKAEMSSMRSILNSVGVSKEVLAAFEDKRVTPGEVVEHGLSMVRAKIKIGHVAKIHMLCSRLVKGRSDAAVARRFTKYQAPSRATAKTKAPAPSGKSKAKTAAKVKKGTVSLDIRPFFLKKNKHGQGRGQPLKVPYLTRVELPVTSTMTAVIEAAKAKYFEAAFESLDGAEYNIVDRHGSMLSVDRERELSALFDGPTLARKIIGVMIQKPDLKRKQGEEKDTILISSSSSSSLVPSDDSHDTSPSLLTSCASPLPVKEAVPNIKREDFSIVQNTKGSPHVLGRGTFASVYLATWANSRVAVKTFSVAECDKDILTSLTREAAMMRKLHHPNIASVYGLCHDEEEGEAFILMQLVDGVDLQTALFKKNSTTKIPDTFPIKGKIACGLSAAVGYMHFHDIIHQDIKPSNVMLAKHPPLAAYLCDLGAATIKQASLTATLTQTGRNPVTPIKYVAPECDEGMSPGKSADVWSLGCTLAELFSGVQLWDLKAVLPRDFESTIKSKRRAKATPDAANAIDVVKYKSTQNIIMRMLNYNYKGRISCDEVCNFFLDEGVFYSHV